MEEKISRMTDEFRAWIIQTLKSGASPESIAAAMIKKGFDPIFSYSTLLRIVGGQSVPAAEPYKHELPAIAGKGNRIDAGDRQIEVLMRLEKPFVLYLDNVLSGEECDELIEASKDRLQPSTVIDPATGEVKNAPGRTSAGTYFSIHESPLISRLEQRLAKIIDVPVEHGEGLQVLHYRPGEEYKPHFDYFPDHKVDPNKGGQRIGTLLLYLNDVASGGETIFPKIGLSITPKKGTGLYFHYTNSLGQVDRQSLHSSIPVQEGEKWVATKWIRQGKIK